MQFEVIRKSHKKSIVIGVSIFIILGVVLIVRFTFAKYSLVKSIKIAEGTINYKVPDFKIMAMYKQKDNETCTEDSCYNEMAENEEMPESGYTINENKSYCTLDNINKDTKAKLFTNEEGNHVISGLSKSSKCYLYFDKELVLAKDIILANVTVNEEMPDFSKTSCNNDCREATVGFYQAKDDDGWSYYYRGDVENNYVKFGKHSVNTPDIYIGYYSSDRNDLLEEYSSLEACQSASSYNVNCTKISKAGQDMYWRIVRINGDGTIRLIYDGTTPHTNGEITINNIAINQFFNESGSDNAYIGFQYTLSEVDGLGTKSNVLQQLETWYQENLLSFANKIDINAGFCGDRTPYLDTSGTTSGGGTGNTTTYYGAYIRLKKTKSPILTCVNTNDLYTTSSSNKGSKSMTYPIGLITADEVVMAGGASGIDNQNYYLYNGHYYWTLSPSTLNGYDPNHPYAIVECVHYRGGTIFGSRVYETRGIRPVINLKADTQFAFDGTGTKGSITNPYIVK